MALCAVQDVSGAIVVDQNPPADQTQCALVLVAGSEYSSFASIWAIPPVDALQACWWAGLMVPVSLYLMSRLAHQVADVFGK
jgi:hypothetical protein